MAGRVPEPWIPPSHLLDLRGRVGLRHTLVNQRGEWQQRIQAVLYHHGLPQRSGLLSGENRAWVEQVPLPTAAAEQVTVALALTDALDIQIAPIDEQLSAFARRQAGCRALMGGQYGIGPLTSVPILSELGDSRRFSATAPASPSRASSSNAATTPCANSATRASPLSHELVRARQAPTSPMRRGRLPADSCRHVRVDGPQRPSGRNAFPQRDHPINHHVAGPPHGRAADRDKAGRPRAPNKPIQPRPRTTPRSTRGARPLTSRSQHR